MRPFLPLLTLLIILLMACTSPTIESTSETAVTDKSAELSGKEQAVSAADPIPTSIPIKETTMTTLEGTSWRSPDLDKSELDYEQSKIAPFKEQITLEFADGKIGGSAGCNRYFASYKQAGDGTLTFTAIGSTRRACERTLMAAEQQFLQALQATTAFTVSEDGSQLVLVLGEKGILAFSLNS